MTKNGEVLGFWDHLRELFYRLRIPFYAIILSTIVVLVFPLSFDIASFSLSNPGYPTITSFVINKLREDFLPTDVELIPLRWFAPLQVYIFISLILGVIISSPIIAYELYKFINPALHKHERKIAMTFLLSFMVLFISGIVIGYILVVPATLRILILSAEPLGLSQTYEFTQFFSFVAGSLLACGFVMTFPIYLVPLVRVGIIKTENFRKNRKYIYGAIIVLVCIFDPDPSFVTEAFLAIPLFIMMEIAIRVAHRFETATST